MIMALQNYCHEKKLKMNLCNFFTTAYNLLKFHSFATILIQSMGLPQVFANVFCFMFTVIVN